MNRFDRYQELLNNQAARPPLVPDLLQPLHDLARALRSELIDAEVIGSEDGRRFHLSVGPANRPAFRSLILSVAMADGRGLLIGNPMIEFATADELDERLQRFLTLPSFQASLDDLRAAAAEPVEARVERANGMGTVVIVPAGEQQRLASTQAGATSDISVELMTGEPEPDPSTLTQLNAAGLHFEIRQATVEGRTVALQIVRRSDRT